MLAYLGFAHAQVSFFFFGLCLFPVPLLRFVPPPPMSAPMVMVCARLAARTGRSVYDLRADWRPHVLYVPPAAAAAACGGRGGLSCAEGRVRFAVRALCAGQTPASAPHTCLPRYRPSSLTRYALAHLDAGLTSLPCPWFAFFPPSPPPPVPIPRFVFLACSPSPVAALVAGPAPFARRSPADDVAKEKEAERRAEGGRVRDILRTATAPPPGTAPPPPRGGAPDDAW